MPTNRLILLTGSTDGSGSLSASLLSSTGLSSTLLSNLGSYSSFVSLPSLRDGTGFTQGNSLFVLQNAPGATAPGASQLYLTNGLDLSQPGFSFRAEGAFRTAWTVQADDPVFWNGKLYFTAATSGFAAGQTPGARELYSWDPSYSTANNIFGNGGSLNNLDTGVVTQYGSLPTGLTVVNGKLLFAGDQGFPVGRELYSFDGVRTALVRDLDNYSFEPPPAKPAWREHLEGISQALTLLSPFKLLGPIGLLSNFIPDPYNPFNIFSKINLGINTFLAV